MKKLILMFVAAVAVSFAACGGSKTEAPATDDAVVVEEVVVEEAPVEADSVAVEVAE